MISDLPFITGYSVIDILLFIKFVNKSKSGNSVIYLRMILIKLQNIIKQKSMIRNNNVLLSNKSNINRI